jgi:cell division protein FtsB
MRSSVVLKRVLPFFVALAVGLFVASFFVDIMPRFNVRDYRLERCRELQQLRIENYDLRRQNQDLRDQIDNFRRSTDMQNRVARGDVQPQPLGFRVPMPPPPPAAPRYIR